MMGEERAIQILEQRQCCRECVVENCTCAECDKAFEMAIKALKQEPRKGHWEHGKELSKEYRGRIVVDVTYADWHCSNCNYVIKGTIKPKWNFCPNCSADNREVEK